MRKIRGILSLLISAMTVLGLCAPLTALGAEVNGPVPTADVDQTDEAQFGQANYQLNEFDGGYLKKTFRTGKLPAQRVRRRLPEKDLPVDRQGKRAGSGHFGDGAG